MLLLLRQKPSVLLLLLPCLLVCQCYTKLSPSAGSSYSPRRHYCNRHCHLGHSFLPTLLLLLLKLRYSQKNMLLLLLLLILMMLILLIMSPLQY